MIDIDDFKAINDCYGHAMGDRVLLHFSNSLKAIQTDDVRAFRMGGDEFSILFKGCDSEEASRICETLRAHLQSFPKRVRMKSPSPSAAVSSA
jgi:diguanylate cyclase (GGDEF)-like protein